MTIASGPRTTSAATSAARVRRGQAWLRGAGATLAGRVFSILCTLAQVPIALRHLGTDAYGVWMTLVGLTMLLSLADGGLTLGAKNALSAAFGRDDPAALEATAGETLQRLFRWGLVVAAIGLAAAWLIDWAALFHVHDRHLAADLPLAMGCFLVVAGLGLPLTLAPQLVAAVQQPWLVALWNAIGGGLTLLVVAVAAQTGASFLVFIAAVSLLPVAVNVGMGCHIAWRLGWKRWPRANAAVTDRAAVTTMSRWFFVLQAGALFYLTAPAVVISLTAGVTAVALYNLLQRLFGLLVQVHWLVLAPLWPAYAEAGARGDHEWVRRSVRLSWWITAGGFLPVLFVTAWLAPTLLRWWIGASAPAIPPALLWTAAAWHGLFLLNQPPATLLNGLGRLRGVAIATVVGVVVAAALMFGLGSRWGAPGVLVGLSLGFSLIGWPATLIASRRALAALPS